MLDQQKLQFSTRGRGTYNITSEIMEAIRNSGIKAGICHLFIQHTSASLILCENADRTVREDLDAWMARLVKDGDSLYKHNDEGPDDMAAHIRTILTQSSLSIPLRNGQCDLGTWQGIYLWEHRTHAHRRTIAVTIMGE
ncbi:MAG: secondary thiamine-phosphate synthase enzyme YjbQ [Gammaproteobacteria bacterium]|jgi:secondary thiamine-phosphate synthase enzyme|nr:secondary thiamine-phosphate synthase enzyme YjbQ [Gammaproteobacteria bacterium]